MKKGLAYSLIALFAVLAIVFAVVHFTNNADKTKQIAALDADVADKAGQIETLNADVADKAGQIETLNADVADKAGQIETLNADVADKAGQIKTLNADVADKAGQIDTLNADVADKAAQIETLNADVADKAGQIESLNADVADKAAQIDTLKADVADKAGQIETMKADVADKKGQIEALNANVINKAGQIETLNADVADKAGQIETLNADVADKVGQIETLKADVAGKAKEIETLNASNKGKDSQIEKLESEAKVSSAEIEDLKKKSEEKDKTITDLKEKLSVAEESNVDYSGLDEAGIIAVADEIKPKLESYGYTVVIKNYNKNRAAESLADVDAAFLEDLAQGITDYINHQTKDISSMTDDQVVEYNCDLLHLELDCIEKYASAEFVDKDLGDLAKRIISSLSSQIDSLREYYGKDVPKYQEEAAKATDIYLQSLYKIQKKYGINVSDSIKKSIVDQGSLSDACIEITASIERQLEEIKFEIGDRDEYSIETKAMVLKNDTDYDIYSLIIKMNLYDQDNNFIEDKYFFSGSSINAGSDLHIDKTIFFNSFDHMDFNYEITIFGQGGSRSLTGTAKPKESFSWNKVVGDENGTSVSGSDTNTAEDNNATVPEQKGVVVGSVIQQEEDGKSLVSEDEKNTEIDSNGILFMDIPWGVSKETYVKEMIDKGFIEEPWLGVQAFEMVNLYTGDDKVFDWFAENYNTIRFTDSKKQGGRFFDDSPLKKYGGLVCSDWQICFSFEKSPDGLVNEDATHVYSMELDFVERQDGKQLLNDLTEKYGKPKNMKKGKLKAAVWTIDNTKLVYFMGENDLAGALWYINTDKSNALKERINNWTPDGSNMEDMGI